MFLRAFLFIIIAGLAQAETSPPKEPKYSMGPHTRKPLPSELTPQTRPQGRFMHFRLPAPRGRILDRMGRVMVDNQVRWGLGIRLPKTATFAEALSFAKIHVEYAQNILKKKIQISEERLEKHFNNRLVLAYKLGPILTEKERALLEKNYLPKLSEEEKNKNLGLYLFEDTQRFYPEQDMAAHVLGYTGKAQRLPLTKIVDFREVGDESLDPWVEDQQGKDGIEKAFDKELKGQDGVVEAIVKEDQSITRERVLREAQAGKDISITLDLEWQKIAEKQLKGKRGAFVVLDIPTGEAMVLASSPRYNPSEFAGSIDEDTYNRVEKDSQNPLLPRATMGTYPPGSTFKVATALAALKSDMEGTGIETPFGIDWGSSNLLAEVAYKTTRPCETVFYVGPKPYHNWNKEREGDLNLFEAIARSCNTWFYPVGMATGQDNIIKAAEDLGLGIKPGIKYLSEESGYLPREKFVNKGDIASLSIGQGSVLVSPLQLANMMRTVALMGEHSSPSIINERLNGITVDDSIPRAQIVSEIPKNIFPLVANGLLQVIKNPLGSGAAARQSSFEVAGKTGTAQWKYKNTASNVVWFSGFFPFQRPKYAYAVLVEGSAGTTNMSGGANAAPLLGAFINEISNDEFIEKINTWMAQGRSMPQYRYVTPHLDERSGRSADDEAPVRRAVRAR